jgi:hypothetical protein
MSFTQRNLCLGCIHDQPNQLAHMDFGGCLHIDSEEDEEWETDSDASVEFVENFEPMNLAPAFSSEAASEALEQAIEQYFEQASSEAAEEDEAEDEGVKNEVEVPKVDVSKPLVEPLFALPCGFEFSECAICFEKIDMVNVTVTTCGHAFHSSCAFKALENNDCCPMCRHQLLDAPMDDESEGEYEESVDEGASDEDSVADSDEGEEDVKVNLEQLAGKLTNMGYTMTDLLKFFISDVKSETNEQKYSEEFVDKMEQDINGVIEGTITLAHRDVRSYAAVAAAPKPLAVQVQPVAVAVAQVEA